MNIEILSANVKTDKSHKFSFNKPVQQYMVGFSQIDIEYPKKENHVKQISFDLTDVQQTNNEFIVKPQLRINNNSGNRQSSQSSVTIVVIATIGNENSDTFTNIQCVYELIILF